MSEDGAGGSLFRHLLGAADFDRLPSPIRRLHLQQGGTRYSGEVEVIRGDGLLSRLCAWMTRLPPAGRGPIRVDIEANGLRETWTRHVAGHAMRSQLRADAGVLVERLGLTAFRFQLAVRDDAIVWSVVGVRVLGLLPLPGHWFHQVGARESSDGMRYCFDVSAALPLAGLLVRYRGWLALP